ncbi:hypothetical protein [Conexibacter sp. SYSU D00693]|uniref:hypothetical protein n=1 Tax=Conexibacter sp. SYSU D00693 TaxID=2812560 RepID=UPI00196ACDCA|nr:hypothetical protein [Conexibacter sp. SYSU D00693]
MRQGGGGYGSPLDRPAEKVLADVCDGFVTARRAEDAYGVVLTGDPDRWETLAVDEQATAGRRAQLRAQGWLDRDADDATRAGRDERSWWLAAAI